MWSSRVIAAAIAAFATASLAVPATAQVNDQHYRGGRTSGLANLCAASESDPGGQAARAWCYGFIVSAGQYHTALTAADPSRGRIFCLPEPAPTLDEFRRDFVAWAQSNPQYGDDKAIDGLARFAASKYPCPSSPPPARTRR
ncbi:MAG TPA: Rap1a/Tai family immunity protein [Acetobacteraceae bacterium]|nr:Rap1a/Tai family immunity protein [Acetobacteraceae bacterium]